MEFEKEYLTDLVKGKTKGDFPPFSSGKWKKSDEYLKQIVGRLKDIKSIQVEADFNHYGSGFSSYVHLYLSKTDKSDTKISQDGELRTGETNGLMMYLCRMAPFSVYGEGTWHKTFNKDKGQSGSSHYIEPEDIGTTPESDWGIELNEIQNILNQYGISVLTKVELDKKLEFKISIPTILSEPPFKVFDCLFYWED
ncbi:hypothetical protein ACFO3O_01135 [Dokdonia ponticola]|uniref:DUF4304 domain-containing protein n=1 Tax=Dokdonia ponticola TaxID=2041041 RepID=A0ABV9HSL6_9FLAO